MTPRKRSSRKSLLPPNLYESRGYYSYRNPRTDEWFGLGRDRQDAVNQAIEANLYLAGQLGKARLVDKISGTADKTVAEWLKKYDEILADRQLAKGTRVVYAGHSRRMLRMLGADTKLRAVTALQVSDGLDGIAAAGKQQTAKLLRGWMKDCFAAASVKGWRDENDNPVRDTRAAKVTVKRSRLSFEMFQQLYASSSGWLQNAMALALVSGQRRGDITSARFKDIHDGFWWVDQGKTGARLCIPVQLRLDCFGMSLDDVIRQCRSTGVLSHYLIHQDQRIGGHTTPGGKMHANTLTERFTDEVEALALDWSGKNAPTFHEIRSLAARLYKLQGNVNTKDLLGHKSESSATLYQEGRGEWIQVRVGTV